MISTWVCIAEDLLLGEKRKRRRGSLIYQVYYSRSDVCTPKGKQYNIIISNPKLKFTKMNEVSFAKLCGCYNVGKCDPVAQWLEQFLDQVIQVPAHCSYVFCSRGSSNIPSRFILTENIGLIGSILNVHVPGLFTRQSEFKVFLIQSSAVQLLFFCKSPTVYDSSH